MAGHAERAVIHVTSGAARDLAKLGGRQIAVPLPVEFAQSRKGHMVEIEIEAHANGVGRHEKVDVTVLIEIDLGIARARA